LPWLRLTDDNVIQKLNAQDNCGFFDLASLSHIGITRIWVTGYAASGIMQSIFRPASRRGRNRGREKK